MTRITRTFLAVPAHREKMLAAAAASAADAVFLDLEDAVPEASKPDALASAIAALANLDWGQKTVAVRVNALNSPHLPAELAGLQTAPRLNSLIIPKTETAADLNFINSQLNPASKLALEALIETAAGVLHVDTIAASGGRLIALHFGPGDFSASIGARGAEIGGSPAGYAHTTRTDSGLATIPLDLAAYPMMRLLIAARAYGLAAIDGPFGNFKDPELSTAAAVKAAAMGYDGKQVIHPSQIIPTRDAFMPSEAEIAFARRVRDAMAAAEAANLGAIQVDGKLIDAANLRMIERTLALAGVATPQTP
jgi:malyl-CoA/(S)-citramalyl-CoA lyase